MNYVVTPAARPAPGWRRGVAGFVAGLVVCLFSATLLLGCRKQSAENLGLVETSTAPSKVALTDSTRLTQSDLLLQIAALSHGEVATRLGPHRIESKTRWTLTPVSAPPPLPEVAPGFRPNPNAPPAQNPAAEVPRATWDEGPANMEETRVIEVDDGGRLHLATQNDHGYGVEAILDQDFLYQRMRYASYIRRHPEGDEVNRLRASAYESGASLLELVLPALRLSTPTDTTVLERPCWQVTLSLKDGKSAQAAAHAGLGKEWRKAATVEALEGTAVVDRQHGTLLSLQLHTRFRASRKGEGDAATLLEVEAQHEMQVTALGAAVAKVAVPEEWSEPPSRPRPMLDRQELLNGLVPARR